MIVLDVDDELGEGLELETAAAEPAGVGEERSGGDARHAFGCWCIHRGEEAGSRGGTGGGGSVFGFTGVGAPLSCGADTGGSQTGQRRTQLGSRRDRWGWGWAPAAWWPPTSQPEYLEGCVAPGAPAEIL